MTEEAYAAEIEAYSNELDSYNGEVAALDDRSNRLDVLEQRCRVLLQKEQNSELRRADSSRLPEGQICALREPVLGQRKLVNEAMRLRGHPWQHTADNFTCE